MIDFNPESFKTPPPGVWLAPAEPPAEVPPPKTYNAPVAISAEDVDFLEQHFLGSVCHRPEKVSQGLAMLDGDDFASPACARFFQIIKRQSEIGGVDIDVARKEALGAGLSVVWLAGLTDCIPGNVDRLARQIKATANRRRAIAELKRLESGQSLAETIDALSRLRCAEGCH